MVDAYSAFVQVHPDKCRCFGAESAFILVQKAAILLAGANDGEKTHSHTSGGMSGAWWEEWDPFDRPRAAPPQANAQQVTTTFNSTDYTVNNSKRLKQVSPGYRICVLALCVGGEGPVQ
jgi:hypothetical protein